MTDVSHSPFERPRRRGDGQLGCSWHPELISGNQRRAVGALKDNLAFEEFEAVYDPQPGWCCVAISRVQS